jgi:hypothetical protein
MILAGCRFCGKLVPSYNKRPVCERHALIKGFGEAIWLEWYGPRDEGLKCSFEEDSCSVEFEPNGGFVCLDCFSRSKHSVK